jgi:hypothetical protein
MKHKGQRDEVRGSEVLEEKRDVCDVRTRAKQPLSHGPFFRGVETVVLRGLPDFHLCLGGRL